MVSKQECIEQYYKLVEKLDELHEIRKRIEKDFLMTDTIKTMRFLYQDIDNVFPLIEQQLENELFDYDKLKKSFEIRINFVQRRIDYLKEMSDEIEKNHVILNIDDTSYLMELPSNIHAKKGDVLSINSNKDLILNKKEKEIFLKNENKSDFIELKQAK